MAGIIGEGEEDTINKADAAFRFLRRRYLEP